MKIFCGTKQLTGRDGIAAPEIIRLVRGGEDVDLTKLYLDVNSNANDHSLLFRYSKRRQCLDLQPEHQRDRSRASIPSTSRCPTPGVQDVVLHQIAAP